MRSKVCTKEEYLKLVDEIKKHDELYFEKHQPLISDYEYDLLVKQCEEIEKLHPDWVSASSPTQAVREKPTKGFYQMAHSVPMLSLANSYSEEEIRDFIKRVYKILPRDDMEYSAELKMDGIAVSLRYEKGKFVRALTRGNGKVGDDITKNIATISSLPKAIDTKNLPDVLELRAEVYMLKKVFSKLNEQKEEAGQDVWANPRNAAAGSLKLLDTEEVKRRSLSIMVYGLAEGIKEIPTQEGVQKFLKEKEFPTFSKEHFAVCSGVEDLLKFANTIEETREDLPFEIDGIVIKVNTIRDWEKLGATGKSPRWAIAYKYAPLQAKTRIHDITLQVGRTGVLTPVAELDPVFLAGSTISRATLHNEDEIQRKDIRKGDHVIIEKGGDVIPKVVSVDFSKREKNSTPFVMPKHCPVCSYSVVKKEGEVAVRCSNSKCAAKNERRLMFFASKPAMNIDNLGEKVMKKLIENGLVKSMSDIYRLTKIDIAGLEGFKEKSIQNLLSSIESSKKISLARFILALGVPFVGTSTAELIAEYAKDVKNLQNLTEDELILIDGVGDKVAHSFVEYFSDENHLHEIEQLLDLGVQPESSKLVKIEGHSFSGKSFVLTGSLEKYSRTDAGALIKERGGKVSSSVTKKTDFVIAGSEPGSKYDKAVTLKVTILTEDEFLKML